MPITNNSRVLNYLPYAIGSYGTGFEDLCIGRSNDRMKGYACLF